MYKPSFRTKVPSNRLILCESIGQRRFPFSRWNRRDCPMSNDVIRLEGICPIVLFVDNQTIRSLPPSWWKWNLVLYSACCRPNRETKNKKTPNFLLFVQFESKWLGIEWREVTRASSVFKSIVLFYMCEISHTNFEWRKPIRIDDRKKKKSVRFWWTLTAT